MTPASHGDSVSSSLDFMLGMDTAAPAPTPPEAPQDQPPAPAALPEPPVAAVVRQRPQSPKTAPKPVPPVVPAPASPAPVVKEIRRRRKKPAELKRMPVAVNVDRDLVALMRLALPALGGLNHAQVIFDAGRAHHHEVALLPDAPVVMEYEDDYYGEMIAEAAHRMQLNPYMAEAGRTRLDADAEAAELSRSDYVCRVLRAYLTVSVAFVPADRLHLLSPPHLDTLVTELKARLDAGVPPHALPAPGRQPWAKVDLPEGSELRALTDEAREGAMPGCMSATEAILTVLL